MPSARARYLGAEAVLAQKGAFASVVFQDVRDAGCVRGAADAITRPAPRSAALEQDRQAPPAADGDPMARFASHGPQWSRNSYPDTDKVIDCRR